MCTVWCKYPFGFREEKNRKQCFSFSFFTLFLLYMLFNDDPTQSFLAHTNIVYQAQTDTNTIVFQKLQSEWKCVHMY